MHITNQKSFLIKTFLYIYGKKFKLKSLWNMVFILMIFDIKSINYKRKIYNFDPFNVLLSIAIKIPQRLKTGFVVQRHIWL